MSLVVRLFADLRLMPVRGTSSRSTARPLQKRNLEDQEWRGPCNLCPVTAANQFDVRVHGTTFFIDPHGTFVTASHVIKSIAESKDKSCETPAVLVRTDRSAFTSLNLYGLKFIASDCRIDESADIAQCKTVVDPTEDKKIVAKPPGHQFPSYISRTLVPPRSLVPR